MIFTLLHLHHHPTQISTLTTAIPGVTDLIFALFIDSVCFKAEYSSRSTVCRRLPTPTWSILTSPSSQHPQPVSLTSLFDKPPYSYLKKFLHCYSLFNMLTSCCPQLDKLLKNLFLSNLPIRLCGSLAHVFLDMLID